MLAILNFLFLPHLPQNVTFSEVKLRPAGPQFHSFTFFFFWLCFEDGCKICLSPVPKALFSLHDISNLKQNDLEGTLARFLSPSWHCPSDPRGSWGMMSCKQSLTQPSLLSGSSPPPWALLLTCKACHSLSVRTEAKKAVNTSVFSLQCLQINCLHSTALTLCLCLAFCYSHSNGDSCCLCYASNFSSSFALLKPSVHLGRVRFLNSSLVTCPYFTPLCCLFFHWSYAGSFPLSQSNFDFLSWDKLFWFVIQNCFQKLEHHLKVSE